MSDATAPRSARRGAAVFVDAPRVPVHISPGTEHLRLAQLPTSGRFGVAASRTLARRQRPSQVPVGMGTAAPATSRHQPTAPLETSTTLAVVGKGGGQPLTPELR